MVELSSMQKDSDADVVKVPLVHSLVTYMVMIYAEILTVMESWM